MIGPFEAQVETLTEGVSVFHFTKASVERLRKDYFAIMRNLPRIKTAEQARIVQDGIRKFRSLILSMFSEDSFGGVPSVLVAIERAMYGELYRGDAATAKRFYDLVTRDIRGKAWQFTIDLHLETDPNNYSSDAYVGVSRFDPTIDPKKLTRLRDRLGRKAKVFFDEAEWVVNWLETAYRDRGEEPKPLVVKQSVSAVTELEGFKVVLKGYDPEDARDGAKHRDALRMLIASLRDFKTSAARRYPLVLKKMLPLVAEFQCGFGGAGGEYKIVSGGKPVIFICPRSYNTVDEYVRVIAHEMAHHLHRTVLKPQQRDWWYTVVKADYTDFDPHELLAAWGDERWASDLYRRLIDENPVLAIQLDTIRNWPDRYGELSDVHDLKVLLAKGPISLPKHPISWYATKNPEEAFCEAFGHWIAYGERRLHAQTLGLLKHALGID